jgi:hypothetical protein
MMRMKNESVLFRRDIDLLYSFLMPTSSSAILILHTGGMIPRTTNSGHEAQRLQM